MVAQSGHRDSETELRNSETVPVGFLSTSIISLHGCFPAKIHTRIKPTQTSSHQKLHFPPKISRQSAYLAIFSQNHFLSKSFTPKTSPAKTPIVAISCWSVYFLPQVVTAL